MAAPIVGTQRMLGVSNATSGSKFLPMRYISSVVTAKLFTAPIPLRVTAIQGVPTTAGSGGACTLAFWKAPDGIAIDAGTLLSNDTFNVAGTADINQYLRLIQTPGVLDLAPGDSLGWVLTGTATSAVGEVTITVGRC